MKRLIFFFVSALLTTVMTAQNFGLSTGAGQQLLEQAVKDGLAVVHSYYQLRDISVAPPVNYGWNNRPHFGETLSLGVWTDSGCLLADQAVHPWMYDPKFEQYRNQNRYVPVLLNAEYRQLDSAAYRPAVWRDSAAVELSPDRLYAVTDSTFCHHGFTVDRDSGVKNGWLVWVVSDTPLSGNAAQPLSLIVHRYELTFTDGQPLCEVRTLSTERTVLGGIYILPQITGIGQITVKLSGFLHRENDKWHVVKAASLPPSAPAGVSGGLTPAATLTPVGSASDSADGASAPARDSSGKSRKKTKKQK